MLFLKIFFLFQATTQWNAISLIRISLFDVSSINQEYNSWLAANYLIPKIHLFISNNFLLLEQKY